MISDQNAGSPYPYALRGMGHTGMHATFEALLSTALPCVLHISFLGNMAHYIASLTMVRSRTFVNWQIIPVKRMMLTYLNHRSNWNLRLFIAIE